jgi:hypothetical protein
MPGPVSISLSCRHLCAEVAWDSTGGAMRAYSVRGRAAMAGCSGSARGQLRTKEGRHNRKPPFTNPQPRVSKPMLV